MHHNFVTRTIPCLMNTGAFNGCVFVWLDHLMETRIVCFPTLSRATTHRPRRGLALPRCLTSPLRRRQYLVADIASPLPPQPPRPWLPSLVGGLEALPPRGPLQPRMPFSMHVHWPAGAHVCTPPLMRCRAH